MTKLVPSSPSATVRLDKWLWAVRLFKTRGLAATSASAGKIKRQGKILKPATALKSGDLLEFPAPDGTHKRSIEVIELLIKRVGAPLAQQAYKERTSPDILADAAKRKALDRANRLIRKKGDQGRMTKRQRRVWERDHDLNT